MPRAASNAMQPAAWVEKLRGMGYTRREVQLMTHPDVTSKIKGLNRRETDFLTNIFKAV